MQEIKTDRQHYFLDDQNCKQGEYKRWYDNGQICVHTYYYDGKDLEINPDDLSDKDKLYIAMSGKVPCKKYT